MPYTELLLMLRNLKLYGMEEAFTEASQQPGFSQLTKESLLSDLVRAEIVDRQARSINYQMGTAKFPVYRDLDSFDFASSEVNEEQIRTLRRQFYSC
jgi:DNA-binding IclR family transcriptional regulator